MRNDAIDHIVHTLTTSMGLDHIHDPIAKKLHFAKYPFSFKPFEIPDRNEPKVCGRGRLISGICWKFVNWNSLTVLGPNAFHLKRFESVSSRSCASCGSIKKRFFLGNREERLPFEINHWCRKYIEKRFLFIKITAFLCVHCFVWKAENFTILR